MKNILIIFFYINFLFFPQIALSKIAPSPYCFEAELARDIDSINDFDSFEIILNERKLKKQVFKKIQSKKDSNIDFKQWIKAKIHLTINGNKCTLKSKIRITGDGSEHIDNSFNSSLLVKIENSSIIGIKRFKLFLPQSRNGINEVITANLFSELGFLSPQTFYTKIKINNSYKDFIFQEDIQNEFIDNNELSPGILFEGKENSGNNLNVSFAKIINDDWPSKNNHNLLIAKHALTKINSNYLQSALLQTNSHVADMNIISNLNNSSDQIGLELYNQFEALAYALNSEHMLSKDDRRFFFDPVYGRFVPIYYDGRSSLSRISLDQKIITSSAKKGVKGLLEKLDMLDVKNFLKKLQNSGVSISSAMLNNILINVKSNLNEMVNLDTYRINKSITQEINFNEYESKNIAGFIFDNQIENNLYEVCTFELSKCKLEIIDESEIIISLTQKLINPDNKVFIFIGSLDKSNILKNIKYNYSIFNFEEIDFKSNFSIKYTGDIYIETNSENRTIDIYKESDEGNVVFLGGKISNWQIRFFNESTNVNEIPVQYSNEFGLTGCLNFYDLKINNVKIESYDSNCEDAINFKRVEGDIIELKVINSNFDAIDVDFSKLKVSKTYIEKAKNDCLDFSKGDYVIENAFLSKCGDKGISLGEKSSLIAKNIEIIDSITGIASKDSSKGEIHNYVSKNNSLCASTYRKKPEYYGGILYLYKSNCDLTKIKYDDKSKIIYSNLK